MKRAFNWLLLPIIVIMFGIGLCGVIYRLYTEAGGGISGLVIIGLVLCGALFLNYVRTKREQRAPNRPTDFDTLADDQKARYVTWLNRLLPISFLLIAGGLCVAVLIPSQNALWVTMALVSGSIVFGLGWYLRHLSGRNRNARR